MKRLLLIILLLSLTGCTQKFGADEKIADNLKLKVSADKVLDSKDETITKCSEYSTKGSSTCVSFATENIKRYTFISNEKIEAEKYKELNENVGKRLSNAQFFEDGKKGIAKIYFNDKFGGTNNEYKIDEATTTKASFEEQTKPSLISRLIKPALADISTSSTNNGDSTIQNNGVPNQSTEVQVDVHTYNSSTAIAHGLWNFTLPGLSGTISDVKLFLYKTNGTVNRPLNLHKIKRTDIVFSEVTWTIYKSGSNWDTAGATGANDYDSTIISSTNINADNNAWTTLGVMGATATNSLTLNWGDTVTLMLKPNIVTSDGDYARYISKEYTTDTTKRPYLEITYNLTPVTPESDNNDIIWFD